jgi:hypothetical protein
MDRPERPASPAGPDPARLEAGSEGAPVGGERPAASHGEPVGGERAAASRRVAADAAPAARAALLARLRPGVVRGFVIAPRPARSVLVVAVLAGIVLVGPPAGIGLTVALFALGFAVAAAPAPAPGADLRVVARAPGRDPWARVWWSLAAALACIPVLRAATWVVLPSVAVAAALAAIAVSGRVRTVLTRVPAGSWRTGAAAWDGASARGALPAVRGVVLAAGLLALFVPLLLSADAAFAQLVGDVIPSGSVDLPFARVCVFALVLGGGGALLDAGARPPLAIERARRRHLGRAEWALPLGALVALLGAFVATQLATLFGGNRHVLETAGLTYAEYAHSGFAQMAVVAALTLLVIAAAARWARDGGSLLRALLGTLCVLTLVVIASALRRLELYEEAYGFTRLRLTADAILLWLGSLFVLVLAAGVFGGAWLPRAAVAVTGAAVLLFALSNPDRRIAVRNLDRGSADLWYLDGLSADALPALARWPEASCAIVRRMGPGDGVVGWNVARAQARGMRVTC